MAIYRERSKELIEMFRKMGLDLKELTDLDNRFAKESLAEAERLRAAYLRAGPSDLTNYLAAKTAQAYTLGSNERLLLTGTVATLGQRLLESNDPPGPPPPQFGDQRNGLDLRADGHGTWFYDQFNAPSSPVFSFTWTPDSTTYYSFSSFLHFLGYSLFSADHRWYNEKGAGGTISATVTVYQDVPQDAYRYYRDFGYIWSKHLDNGDELVPFDLTIPIDGGAILYQGYSVSFSVQLDVLMMATGGGSVAEVNFSKPGDGIYCGGLKITVGK
jgi:hypothetical protein